MATRIWLLPCFLACVFVSTAYAADAPAAPALPIPAVPLFEHLYIPDMPPLNANAAGEFEWLGIRIGAGAAADYRCTRYATLRMHWNPSTGKTGEDPVLHDGKPMEGSPEGQVALENGVLWLTNNTCPGQEKAQFHFLGKDGRLLAVDTDPGMVQYPLQVQALSATSAALVIPDPVSRYLRVHVVSVRDGKLVDEAMPELAIPYRRDFAATAYGSGNLMILGGSNSEYRGCSPCRSDTHILDVATRTWKDGPSMLESRSELDATTLPDGSVLVSGGYTRLANWSTGPSRTAERLFPVADHFEAIAPMPVGNARHHGVWMPGSGNKILLMGSGIGKHIAAYDIASGTWRVVASNTRSNNGGGCGFFPFMAGGQMYAWIRNQNEANGKFYDCIEQKQAGLVMIRPFADDVRTAAVFDPQFLAINRGSAGFLPAQGELPALAIGGDNTAMVDVFGTDGRFEPAPELLDTRNEGRVLRMHGGVFVFGGHVNPDENPDAVPMEWLESGDLRHFGRWRRVEGTPPAKLGAVAALSDGSLIEVDAKGDIHFITLDTAHDPVTLKRTPGPTFDVPRRPSEGAPILIRQLADGRIVFAGGETNALRVALVTDDVNKPQARDTFAFLGTFQQADTYTVYDPKTQQWTASASALRVDGVIRMFGNGRVAWFGGAPAGGEPPAEKSIVVSSATGDRWIPLRGKSLPHVDLTGYIETITLDDELFVKGSLPASDNGPGKTIVEWFDPEALTWTTVWTIDDQPSAIATYNRVKLCHLPNGKTVLLPEMHS
ncbi:kelch repeat-containing protein [Luteibacter rhizovicinus]|nr:kelch repeat-containing protein [Luteibacter rhizovicinus]